ncbi:MAG: guanylate kinase [Bacteroidales bacterium]
MTEGKLIIFSAPSGAGKSTIVGHLMGLDLGLSFSTSATSRPPRPGERDGREYHFLSPQAFRRKIEENAFLEWEEVYRDQYYGTLKSEVDRIWSEGRHAIFDIDVQGGMNLKNQYGERALSVFIQPPSLLVLESRLRNRGTEDPASLRKRIDKAAREIRSAPHFDHILVNDNLDQALTEAEALVRKFLAT